MERNVNKGTIPYDSNGIVLIIIVGLFFMGNFFVAPLNKIALIIEMILIGYLVRKNEINKKNLPLVLVLLGLVFFYTYISPYREYVLGTLIIYLNMSLMVLLVFKNVKFSSLHYKFINFGMLVILIIGILITLKNKQVISWLSENYFIFANKQYQIVEEFKPIIFYDLHSYAGFFLCIFAFLNLEFFKNKKAKLNLFCFVGYMYLLFKLRSTTGVYLIALLASYIGLDILIILYNKNKLTLKNITMTVLVAAICVGSVGVYFKDDINKILSSKGNGFAGRYSEEGVLAKNIDFITENPLTGVGVAYTKELYWGDSGMIENLTRLSVLGAMVYYLALFIFIRSNINKKQYVYSLFTLIILLELGMSIIFYFRTQFLIPVIIVYLNGLDNKDTKSVIQI